MRLSLNEGAKIITLSSPIEILEKSGKVSGVVCAKMTLGQFDRSGRRRPVSDEDTFTIEADQVIVAVGQTLEASKLFKNEDVAIIDGKKIEIDEKSGATSAEGVFAGGAAATGPASIIEAIASGERAAIGIDNLLTGEEHAFWHAEARNDTYFDPDADPVPDHRAKLNTIPVERRKSNFEEVEKAWTESEAIRQAKRCMRCDYGKELVETD